MKSQAVNVLARVIARPGKVDELMQLLQSLIGPSRSEPGCLSYELLHNIDSPEDFTFVEQWESRAALEAHMTTKHFRQAARQLPALVAGEPDIRRYRNAG